MSSHLPRPFASGHRAGNSRQAALAAIDAGADLLETDIWLHRGRLELRHEESLGPFPFLWEKRLRIPHWYKRFTLHDLLKTTPETTLLFLDFKGKHMGLGPAVLAELERTAPNRVVATCGRNYPQLRTIADAPNIITFYSVGTEEEWPVAQEYIAASPAPALSLIANMATEERINWMKERGGVIVCWGVEDTHEMERLFALGVDGFTTDHADVLTHIREMQRRLGQILG
ncbi:MAG: glycerophosphodiester phosphodiesterase [Thermomicrobiales bacterium]|nr:glycerophosphodiester phosphodiesterase [Thermomicrobiales bacterium]